jgi:hypothetical protein
MTISVMTTSVTQVVAERVTNRRVIAASLAPGAGVVSMGVSSPCHHRFVSSPLPRLPAGCRYGRARVSRVPRVSPALLQGAYRGRSERLAGWYGGVLQGWADGLRMREANGFRSLISNVCGLRRASYARGPVCGVARPVPVAAASGLLQGCCVARPVENGLARAFPEPGPSSSTIQDLAVVAV